MRRGAEGERPESKEATVKTKMPQVKILFFPQMSAIRPKGTRNVAAERRKERAIQPNWATFRANSFPIAGRAMLMEEPMKGVRKEPKVVRIRMSRW
jgi:hypothetical protein